MGWGNRSSISTAERKKWAAKQTEQRARIHALEDEVEDLKDKLVVAQSFTYHPGACAIWRGLDCSCGSCVPETQEATK